MAAFRDGLAPDGVALSGGRSLKPYHLLTHDPIARVEAAFEDADRRRHHELERALREDARCRFCGRTLTEARMQRSPGCCGEKRCRKRWEQEPR